MHFHRATVLLLLVTFTFTLTLTLGAKAPKQRLKVNNKTGCVYKGKLRPPGAKFRPDPCTTCRCRKRTGVVHCVVKDCTLDRHCLEFSEVGGANTHCCPACVEVGCRHTDGKVYKQGEVIRNEPCVRCYCPLGGGEPVCDVTQCPLSECVDPEPVPGLCCHTCPNGPNCQLGLLTIPLDQSLDVAGETCTCQRLTDKDGQTRVTASCVSSEQAALDSMQPIID